MRRLVLILALAGCSDFPQLDETIPAESRTAPYPQLATTTDLGPATETDTEAETDGLLARMAALLARANALRAQ